MAPLSLREDSSDACPAGRANTKTRQASLPVSVALWATTRTMFSSCFEAVSDRQHFVFTREQGLQSLQESDGARECTKPLGCVS